jgi:phosphatidylglycerophosphate synthase
MGGALALLATLAAAERLAALGWVTGIAVAAAVNVLLARAGQRHGVTDLRLPNRITLLRAMLVAGAAALAADAFPDAHRHTSALVAVATVALVLDAVDGFVARRTDAVSPLGGRFDMEVDAFLIAVLSVYATSIVGFWVLSIGAARYVYGATGSLLPWLRIPAPPRYWRKVVAAVQGVVLTVVAAQLLPMTVAVVATGIALALLAESFGRDVWLQARAGRTRRARLADRASMALAGSR